ncbi:MAG: efflux RND transporter periplasmic adaptor subunit [Bacteroidota bacterium]
MEKKKSNRKYWIIGGVLITVLALAAWKYGQNQNNGMEVDAEQAELRTIVEKVSANGKIQPEIDVKITSEISGKITKIYVKEGDEVKAGDILLAINPDILESTVSRSNANLNNSKAGLAAAKAAMAQAEATFVNAEKDYDRQKVLFQEKVLSNAEWDAAVAAFEVAKSQLESAKQNVNSAEYSVKSAAATRKEASDNLGRTKIYAPADGIITALQVEEGETVLGTIQMAGTELMRVSKLEVMEVAVDVNESDIVKVEMGDTSLVEVDAYRDREFKGIVTEIANTANNATSMMSTDQVTNFSVKIRILNDSYKDLIEEGQNNITPFRTGMSASVDIQTNRGERMLTIPIESVTTREDSTKFSTDSKERIEQKKQRRKKKKASENQDPFECVFVIEDGVAVLYPVKTGIQDDKYIHILKGIKEGDEVITGPYTIVSKKLENGEEVDKKKDEDEEEGSGFSISIES